MNLILLQPCDFHEESVAMLSDERALHIRKVLKAEPGKTLRVGLLNGPLGRGTVLTAEDHTVSLQCVFDEELPPKPKVDLILALPRPKVMKRLWAQLAALGVGRMVVLKAEKVERYYFDSHVLEPDFYNPLLIEGLQQARCTHLPEVWIHQRFKPFIEDEFEPFIQRSPCLFADPSADQTLTQYSVQISEANKVVLIVGPEGGWNRYERQQFEEKGCFFFNIGPRILRTDTACIGLLTALQQLI